MPEEILNKAVKSGNEFGWRQSDFIEVIEAARKLKVGIYQVDRFNMFFRMVLANSKG